jgi:hypothetical protein
LLKNDDVLSSNGDMME